MDDDDDDDDDFKVCGLFVKIFSRSTDFQFSFLPFFSRFSIDSYFVKSVSQSVTLIPSFSLLAAHSIFYPLCFRLFRNSWPEGFTLRLRTGTGLDWTRTRMESRVSGTERVAHTGPIFTNKYAVASVYIIHPLSNWLFSIQSGDTIIFSFKNCGSRDAHRSFVTFSSQEMCVKMSSFTSQRNETKRKAKQRGKNRKFKLV